MKKRQLLLILLSILIVGVFVVNGAVTKTTDWESSNDVLVSVGGTERSLQNAIDSNSFKNSPSIGSISSTQYKGHDFDKIWISMNSNEMTFKDAIDNTDLCGTSNPKTTYSNDIDPGHLGNEVEVTTLYDGQTKSLQDAINDGTLVKTDGGWSSWSTCSASCGDGTQTRTCTNPALVCGGASCSGSNTQSCKIRDCVCSGTTTKGLYNLVPVSNTRAVPSYPGCPSYTRPSGGISLDQNTCSSPPYPFGYRCYLRRQALVGSTYVYTSKYSTYECSNVYNPCSRWTANGESFCKNIGCTWG